MKKCPNCGTKNADSAKHCNFCDTHFSESETVIKKETTYIHDSQTERKKAQKRKLIITFVSVLVVSALVSLLIVVFSNHGESNSQKLASLLTKSITQENTFSGTLKGANVDISFKANVTKESITVLLNGGKYDSLIISKEGMVLETDRESGRSSLKVTPDMEEYKLYVAYLLLTASEKNPLTLETNDIKNHILPIVKEHIIKDFDNIFIEDNFISGISSALMTFENQVYLKDYLGITLPDDVENAKFDFNVMSYNLQNHILSQFKKSSKNSADYEKINQELKKAKSKVKDNYGAKGYFTTESEKLKSASADIIYNGSSYKLQIEF